MSASWKSNKNSFQNFVILCWCIVTLPPRSHSVQLLQRNQALKNFTGQSCWCCLSGTCRGPRVTLKVLLFTKSWLLDCATVQPQSLFPHREICKEFGKTKLLEKPSKLQKEEAPLWKFHISVIYVSYLPQKKKPTKDLSMWIAGVRALCTSTASAHFPLPSQGFGCLCSRSAQI